MSGIGRLVISCEALFRRSYIALCVTFSLLVVLLKRSEERPATTISCKNLTAATTITATTTKCEELLFVAMHFEVHGATTKESASGAAPVGRPRIKAVVVVAT